ncbi:hypothetical protein [Pseudomonas amygdali]|uniref:hypothetical protein n=1 Tax=Pseudomonas amygdali TaxID=47877 RepID=UPI0006E61868|nr:hypothetical protein [Pseudomonas amygdali]KPY55642.1 hypothetical protein ALO93_200076 [Pseudomonas amygdali pv. sesami]
MKVEQKLERLEIRLRPGVAGESEMITALAELDGMYGGKNELMRRCVFQGYLMLKQKMQSVSGSGNEVEAIDRLAHAILGSEYDYRVIKTYLHARQAIAETEQAQGAGKVSSADNSVEKAAANPTPLPVTPVQAALDAVADAIAVKAVVPAAEDGEQRPTAVAEGAAEHVIQHDPVSAPAPAPKHNWAHMRTVAGSTGDAVKKEENSPGSNSGGNPLEGSE